MAGGHSAQNNKSHKPGRRAGAGARARNRNGKVDTRNSSSLGSHLARKGKETRLQAAARSRNQSRQAALQRMRHEHAPMVVQILSLADNVDEQSLWDVLRNACDVGSDARSLRDFEQEQEASDMKSDLQNHSRSPVTLRLPDKHKMRVTLLPPLTYEHRQDIHALADVAKAADVILLCARGVQSSGKQSAKQEATIDKQGALALQVLRSLGLPEIVVAVQGAGSGLKERAAAKKQVTIALQRELPGERKVAALDSIADCVTLLRHLVGLKVEPPLWLRARPHLFIEGAVFSKDSTPEATTGTLLLDAYVRHVGLSANRIVAVPGCGDFNIDRIWAALERVPQHERQQPGMVMLDNQQELELLAQADEQKEVLLRENPQAEEAMDMDQTWPTQEEMAGNGDIIQQRRLAPGTSDYQACWILDDDEDAGEDDEDENGPGDSNMGTTTAAADAENDTAPNLVQMGGSVLDEGPDGGDTDMMGDADDDYDEVEALAEEHELRAQRRQQEVADDVDFPDEIETPHDVPARDRFRKYRGLKSFRTSPWDPKEDLPQDYAKVFAFENFARAKKLAAQATERAVTGVEPGTVVTGTYVRIALSNVPEDAAEAVCGRISAYLLGRAPPLVALALHKHECKLSVVNMTVKKHAAYTEPVGNKEELTIITGVRTFSTRPVLSTNEYNVDKFKLEKFMHDGRTYVMSVFAPIAYPPLPVLVVKKVEGGVPELVATGTVDGTNPDRIVLKRIILSGYPVKIQKKKAVVKYMFFNPEDVKWFQPLEVWTKHGKRGRIKESLGTHGAMKCVFDAPVQQHDSVCIALYKRVFPKWPQDLRFHDSFQ